jgi:hypothetical protein
MSAILFPELQFHDENGVPLAAGTIETYVAGTSTPTPTYTDSTGGTSVGNSITLDAEGRPNSGNGIWLGTTTTYKFIIKDSAGNTIQTVDNISSGGFNGSSSFVTATSESGLTSARVLTAGGGISLTDGGAGSTLTINSNHTTNSRTGTTYTALASDRGKVIKFSTQSTAALYLPAAATLGAGWFCFVINFNTNYLLVGSNVAETINGASAVTVPKDAGGLLIICDGSAFYGFISPYTGANLHSYSTPSSPTTLSADVIQALNSATCNGLITAVTGYTTTGYVKSLTQNVVGQAAPSQITASQNDYAITRNTNVLTANGAYNITGLAVPAEITVAYSSVIYLINSSAFTLTLKHEDAASTAANRFKFSTGADIALAADQTIALIYDNTADRWRNIPV